MDIEYANVEEFSMLSKQDHHSMLRFGLTGVILYFCLCWHAELAAADVGLQVRRLQTLEGAIESKAYSINRLGEIVGDVKVRVGQQEQWHAFLWLPEARYGLPGGMNDLHVNGSESHARAININGVVAGWYRDTVFNRDTAASSIPTANQFFAEIGGPMGAAPSRALAIDDEGRIAGERVVNPNGHWQAFRLDPGTPAPALTNLGTVGGPTSAVFDLDASNGFSVGKSTRSVNLPDNYSAGLWKPSNQIRDLSSGCGAESFHDAQAYGVVRTGDMVYTAVGGLTPDILGDPPADNGRAYLWRFYTSDDHYDCRDLGSLGGDTAIAYSVSLDSIVGTSKNADGNYHAFLHFHGPNASMVDLNTLITPQSGWVLEAARDITTLGRIVGWGTIDGKTEAFMLEVVPEPSTLAGLLVATLVSLSPRRYSRRR